MYQKGFDISSPPSFPCIKVVSAYLATIQLYARSGQIATAKLLYDRRKAESPRCPMGCDTISDTNHLFVECVAYEAWRTPAQMELNNETE